MIRGSPGPEFARKAGEHAARTAIVSRGQSYSYADLLQASESAAGRLMQGSGDLREGRVVFMVPPGFGYAAVQWGIWRAGGVAVPLSPVLPPAECEHIVADSRPSVVVGDLAAEPLLRSLAGRVGSRFERADGLLEGPGCRLPALTLDRRALILYTSGTTSRPKGVVTTHGNIEAQMRTLVEAWGWTRDDRILLVLPLHHVHGIVNVLGCALWSGARLRVPVAVRRRRAVWRPPGRPAT